MATYHLFIDDSGTKDYAPHYGDRRGASKYFVFGGVLISDTVLPQFAQLLIDVKQKFFGCAEVEIKSTWIRNPDSRKERYIDTYNITEIDFNDFLQAYYSAISSCNLTLYASVIDKKQVQDKYPDPYPPCGMAYEFLLQRALRSSDLEKLYVHIDNMTGSAPSGETHKQILNNYHASLRSRGSHFPIKNVDFTLLNDSIRYVDSASHHIIQVADIVAYNSYRQFVDNGDDWDNTKLEKLPLYEYFKMLVPKFAVGLNGQLNGYGMVKFPRSHAKWQRK